MKARRKEPISRQADPPAATKPDSPQTNRSFRNPCSTNLGSMGVEEKRKKKKSHNICFSTFFPNYQPLPAVGDELQPAFHTPPSALGLDGSCRSSQVPPRPHLHVSLCMPEASCSFDEERRTHSLPQDNPYPNHRTMKVGKYF